MADSGLYSADNVARLSAAGVRWISRVPDTSKEARAALQVADAAWQHEATLFWASAPEAPAGDRWVVVRTTQGEERARATLERQQVDTVRHQWEQTLWHLSNQRFACEPDAQAALAKQLKQCPEWLRVRAKLVAHPEHRQPGRPRQGALPDGTAWQLTATLVVDEEAVTRAVQRRASFLVATNVLDPAQLPDQELIQTYKAQSGVERAECGL